MAWSIDLLSLDGSTTLYVGTPFNSARITFALDGPGACEVTLRASDVEDGRWLYGQRRVLVKDDNGVARFGGWLDRLERGGDLTAPEYRATCRGLVVALDQGVVHGDFSRVEQPSTDIAWDLIAEGLAQSDNVWNFTLGTVTGVPTARTRYYCDGDVIGESIRELAEMSSGFDWEIDPTGVFNAWVGGRAVDLSATYSIGPEDCKAGDGGWECTADVSELASYVTGLGDRDDNTPCGPPLVIDFDTTAATTYGRREVVIESESRDEFEMEEKTSEELRARIASQLNVRTSWVEGLGPWAVGDVNVGDIVNAELGTEFGGDASVRCISVAVTLEGLHEFVEMEWEAA